MNAKENKGWLGRVWIGNGNGNGHEYGHGNRHGMDKELCSAMNAMDGVSVVCKSVG